jgi:hypothetical protein
LEFKKALVEAIHESPMKEAIKRITPTLFSVIVNLAVVRVSSAGDGSPAAGGL